MGSDQANHQFDVGPECWPAVWRDTVTARARPAFGPEILDRIQHVLAAGCVAYRSIAGIAVLLPWLGIPGTDRVLLLGLVLVVAILGGVMVAQAWRHIRHGGQWRISTLVVDSAIMLLIFLELGVATSPSDTMNAGWTLVCGTVGLWTAVRGVLAGLSFAGLGVGALLIRHGSTGVVWEAPWQLSFLPLGQIFAALTIVGLFRFLFREALVAYGAVGVGLGARHERQRAQRLIHDTALQTLEAISLIATIPGQDAESRLRKVAALAADEARELRRSVEQSSARAPSIDEMVHDAVATSRRADVTVKVVLEEMDRVDEAGSGAGLSATVMDALAGALREALGNVAKHAGVRHAEVRLVRRSHGLRVTVTDQGIGFDPIAQAPGFGLRESIRARIRGVGGRVHVWSQPGTGTEVELWVPYDESRRGATDRSRPIPPRAVSVPAQLFLSKAQLPG
ncbi:MAG: sensor histidine kinase [Nocardioides sp.]